MYIKKELYAKTVGKTTGYEVALYKNWEDKWLLFINGRLCYKYDDLSVANREYNHLVTLY